MNTDGLVEHPAPTPYPFGPSDVASILDAGLEEHPDRLALIDGDRTWTLAELDDEVASLAGGITPGEHVWFALGNCAETTIGVLATFRAGGIAIFAPGHPTESRAADLLGRLGPTTIIESADTYARIAASTVHSSEVEIDPAAPAAIAFTSGTSGRPKAVVHSQRNLLLPGLVSIDLEPPTKNERIGTQLSLQILNVVALGPISALLRGSPFVVIPRTTPAMNGLLEAVERHGATRLFAVPTQLHDILTHAPATRSLRSLDRIILGGSGADPGLQRDFFDTFEVRPTLSYGLTEAPTGVVRESLDDPIGSGRGFPLPHVNVEILGADDTPVTRGNIGEICLSPATTGRWAHTWTPTLGYLDEPERTAELFRTGRLHTGDLGTLDDDGALSVTGRLDDLIVRGGENIDPLEVEAALRLHPGVHDALVVAEPDERLGQRVIAKVVPAEIVDGGDPLTTPSRLQIHVRSAVDVPLDSVEIVTELPRNDMGKLMRRT